MHPYLAPNLPYKVPEQLLDFKVFLMLAWEAMGLPEPTRLQLDMGNFIQDPTHPKKLVMAHRGAAKSWETDAFCSWRLFLNPYMSIIMLSATGSFATENSKQVKRLIELMPVLEPLRTNHPHHTSQVDMWDVGPAPHLSRDRSFKAMGITSSLAGNRADLVVWDDIEQPNNCLTQDQRDKLRMLVDESKYLFKGGSLQETIVLGTPHHADSLYNGMGRKGYYTRIWPAQYGWTADRYEGEVSPLLVADREANPDLALGGVFGFGQPTHPELFGEEDLRKRAEEGETAGKGKWSAQMMLDNRVNNADKHPLKLSDLIVMDCSPEEAPEKVTWGTSYSNGSSSKLTDLQCYGLPGDAFYGPRGTAEVCLPYTRKIMVIDPSGKGKDETSYCILAELNGLFYTLKLSGLKGGYDEERVLIPLAKLAEQYKCEAATYEANWGDAMFGRIAFNVFKKYAPNVSFLLDGFKVPNTQKEKRIIDTLEPVLNFHKLVVDRKVVEDDSLVLSNGDYSQATAPNYMWQYQMSRLSDDKGCLGHDDRIDVLHLAVSYMQEMLLVDGDKNIVDRKLLQEELEERYIDRQIERGLGGSYDSPSMSSPTNLQWGDSFAGGGPLLTF